MTPADPERVIGAARHWLGTPYHDQASLHGVGCDCLGLVRGVWRGLYGPEPMAIHPTAATGARPARASRSPRRPGR